MSEQDYADSGRVRLVWSTVRDEASYRPGATWEDLGLALGVKPASLRSFLLRQGTEGVKLAERVNRVSGVRPRGTAYLESIVRALQADDSLTWDHVMRFSAGRKQGTIVSALYRIGEGRLVRLLNKNSRKGI